MGKGTIFSAKVKLFFIKLLVLKAGETIFCQKMAPHERQVAHSPYICLLRIRLSNRQRHNASLSSLKKQNTMPVTRSTADKSAYDRDGYIIVRGLFSPEETALLHRLSTDEAVTSKGFDLTDQSGKKTRLTLWFTPGDDTFGLMSRSRKMVETVRTLLGDEGQICHFHSKIMQKEPRTGGAWEWHQDYGYWYKNGFLYPDAMLSVMIALTESNIANGCLQVLRGSHKMQRFEHVFIGEQQGADPEFVTRAKERCALIYAELEPGDALFFHPNTLHRSDANNSDRPRWSIISAYNLDFNVPFREKNPSCITPIEMVENEAILESGGILPNDRDFLLKENEISLNVK